VHSLFTVSHDKLGSPLNSQYMYQCVLCAFAIAAPIETKHVVECRVRIETAVCEVEG
jgi:hypothetical protein